MDPRIERTRRSLQEALLALARERELDDIAVGDIAERAEVNRSTLYQHYADKETLLADALDAAAEEAGADLPTLLDYPADPPAALIGYLEHLDANAALYRRVLGERGSAVAVARLRARLEELVVEGITRSGSAELFTGLPRDIVAAGVAGSVLGVLTAWLSRDPRPSTAEAAGWLWAILLGPQSPRENTAES